MSLTKVQLDDMFEQATVDAYGESEQQTGWLTMIQEHLQLPFETKILGTPVNVVKIDFWT